MTPYTDADLDLVAETLATLDWGRQAATAMLSGGYHLKAAAVLDALAAAGRLRAPIADNPASQLR